MCDVRFLKLFLFTSVKVNKIVYILHVLLWKFKQCNSAKAAAKKICSVYGEILIIDSAVRNVFVNSVISVFVYFVLAIRI